MTYPRIDRTPSGSLLVTGPCVMADGTFCGEAGYAIRSGTEEAELAAYRERMESPAEPLYVRLNREADLRMPEVRGVL